MDKEIPGLRLSLPGVKEERDRQPRWLGDYSYINLNTETLPIDALFSMQYGRALERLIREVAIAVLALGPMHTLKEDVSDSFYHIDLRPTDAPKPGIIFLIRRRRQGVSSDTTNLPYGMENFPPIFCTAAETVVDLVNEALHCNTPALPHRLDDMAEAIVRE